MTTALDAVMLLLLAIGLVVGLVVLVLLFKDMLR